MAPQQRYGARGQTVHVVTWVNADGSTGIEVYDARGGPNSRAKHKTAQDAYDELVAGGGVTEVTVTPCEVK